MICRVFTSSLIMINIILLCDDQAKAGTGEEWISQMP